MFVGHNVFGLVIVLRIKHVFEINAKIHVPVSVQIMQNAELLTIWHLVRVESVTQEILIAVVTLLNMNVSFSFSVCPSVCLCLPFFLGEIIIFSLL